MPKIIDCPCGEKPKLIDKRYYEYFYGTRYLKVDCVKRHGPLNYTSSERQAIINWNKYILKEAGE